MFHRDFMTYHQERFQDYSLLVFKGKKLIALLPANREEDVLHSHQGLSYGGLVLLPKVRFADVALAFKAILQFLESQNISHLYLKQLPNMYCSQPSEELEYLLFIAEATLTRVDLSSTIFDLSTAKITSSGRKDGYRKGKNHGLRIVKSTDMAPFWNEILIPHLQTTHGVLPTHSLEEIQKLQECFPENIQQYDVYYGDKIVGGTTLFITPQVVHTQYIAANKERQKLGTLDFLFFHLIQEEYKHARYFDFGISNTDQGKKLNNGLLYWKESLGGKAQVHRFYKVATKQHTLIDSIL